MTHIHSHSTPSPACCPASPIRPSPAPQHGMHSLEVWSQSIEPGGATPPHRHDCEEVVVVQAKAPLMMHGTESRFRSGDTVLLPRNDVHQLINTGSGPLRLIAPFSMAPVQVELPDGTPSALPWQ